VLQRERVVVAKAVVSPESPWKSFHVPRPGTLINTPGSGFLVSEGNAQQCHRITVKPTQMIGGYPAELRFNYYGRPEPSGTR